MRRVSVTEIRRGFRMILKWVEEGGEQVEITKRGKVVAMLVPSNVASRDVVWPDFAARRKWTFPNGIKGKPLSEIIDEARGEY